MSLIEFIGFVISLAAITFLFLKRMLEERQRRRNPQEYARREALQQENLRRFLKSANLPYEEEKRRNAAFEEEEEEEEDEEEELLPPPRPKKATDRFQPQPSLKAVSQPSYASKPSEHYDVARLPTASSGGKMIRSLKSPRDMLIIKEIFDKPLSMRNRDVF